MSKVELLAEHGVYFLPWVGTNYERGFHGRRLLVLGESHYECADAPHNPLLTRECVQKVIQRDRYAAQFWRYVEQALLNQSRIDGWAPDGASVWNRLAVYNFVQSTVSEPGVRPGLDLFQASQGPFRAILEQLRPERVLVCGSGLWESMEKADDYLHTDVQAYRLLDGTQAWCFATVHPSSGLYSWQTLYPLIIAFLDDPAKLVVLVQAFRGCRADQVDTSSIDASVWRRSRMDERNAHAP